MVVTSQAREASNSVLAQLPLFLRGYVAHGMRRGGKDLGIPTGEISHQR